MGEGIEHAGLADGKRRKDITLIRDLDIVCGEELPVLPADKISLYLEEKIDR